MLVMFLTSERFQVPSQHTTKRRGGWSGARVLDVDSDTALPLGVMGRSVSNVLPFGGDVHPITGTWPTSPVHAAVAVAK
jgi:hypothetical protein